VKKQNDKERFLEMLLEEMIDKGLRRPRRNRKSAAIRSLVRETSLNACDFIVPFFVREGLNKREAIEHLPGVFRYSIDLLVREVRKIFEEGVLGVLLFPWIEEFLRSDDARWALEKEDIIPKAIAALKEEMPELLVVSDIALDPYTSHGHDGVVRDGKILNDETIKILNKMAILHAEAGVDIVAPSDMMDGRVGAIRRSLDAQGHQDVGILSYTAKYASSLYKPFRSALGTRVAFGDKKTYQMDPANVNEALLEAKLDEEEGADMLLIKPATFYLDVIAKIRESTSLPIGAYHVSGEYAMVMAAHEKGILDAKEVFLEALLSIKRAGANFIVSYAVPLILERL
jgi:porphobilinogen synthase